jgi:signal transduction histidine kinase/ActR/RegA family two-component response regulator
LYIRHLTMRSEDAGDRLRGDAIALGLLGHAHRNSPATMAVQAAAAIGVCLIVQPQERSFYLIWLAIVLTLLAGRLAATGLLGAALRGGYLADRLELLAKVHSVGLLVSAGLWALLACVRIPLDSANSRYVLIIVLSALAGGAVGVLSSLKWTGRIYVSLILLPASLTLILDRGVDATLGVLGMIFWIVMMVGHRNNYALLVDALRLRDENRELLEDIARRNHDTNRINHELENRVRARTIELERVSEEAKVANRAKSRFLATVSHEMRTPLNAILGEGQLLAREALTPPQRARLKAMKSASRVMRQLINDILDISQIEAGALQLNLNVFSLEDLTSELRELYRPLADERDLSLVITLPPDIAKFRRGDADRLRQIVGNLISNGLKFTRQGGVTVKIGGDDEQLSISVIDSGIGIDPKDHETIFERFVQVDSSSTREVGGIGLGLSICRELSEQMGGALSVTSARGIGARFDFAAPIPAVVASPAPVETDPAEAADSAPASLLVVDDNPVNRRILAALVEPFGVECGFAANGKEAVEAWRRQPWGAIFMDVHMPGMDGVDATRAIRAEESYVARARTPIIAVTASILPSEVETYRLAGMDDVLPKPIEASALAGMLSRCAAA